MILPLPLGVAALAGVAVSNPLLLPLCVVTFLAVGVVTGTNDIIDMQRDKRKWPRKPLATGLISKSEAMLFTAILAVLTLAIAGLAVSWLFAIAVLATLVLNYVYSAYTRDHIGYASVILPLVAVPMTVWVAVSPGTLSTALPWFVFILFGAFGIAAQITHEALDPTIPALFVRPRPTTERALYVVSVIVTFFFGLGIFLYAQLSWLYLVPLTVFTVWMLVSAKDLGENRSREKLESAYKIIMMNFACLFWLFVAVFVWI
jgi:4-hydroxybenzoate polyprenyltransferase